jgi:hypothetical protein
MSIFKKLQEARIMLQNTKLHKSGHNKFAGYYYFELGDFLPAIQLICHNMQMCGYVTFYTDIAVLTIVDTEDGSTVEFKSPMSSAALKGCHDVQNLGAVQTYLRRYLWVNAFEIVEHDALEATTGKEEPVKKAEPKKAEPKPVEKKAEEFFDSSEPWQIAVDTTKEGWPTAIKEGVAMLIKLAKKPEDVNSIYKINMQLLEKLKAEDVAIFDEVFATFKTTKESLKGQA